MKGVTILDASDGRLSFDLADILDVIGDDARRSRWTIRNAEVLGPSADELHAATVLDGMRLVELARGITQMIDGELVGCRENQSDPWVLVRAVDSSAFDVETSDVQLLEKLRARFTRVNELP